MNLSGNSVPADLLGEEWNVLWYVVHGDHLHRCYNLLTRHDYIVRGRYITNGVN